MIFCTTASPSPVFSPTFSATGTASPLPTSTSTPSPSITPSATASPTPLPSATRTPAAPSLQGPLYQNSGTAYFTGTGTPGDSITILKNGAALSPAGTVQADGTYVIAVTGAGIAVGDLLTAAAGGAGGPTAPTIVAQAAGATTGSSDSSLDGGANAVILTGSPGQPVTVFDPALGEVLGSGTLGPSGSGAVAISRPLNPGETVDLVSGGILVLGVTGSAAQGQPPVLTQSAVLVEGSTLQGHGVAGATIVAVDGQGKILGSSTVDSQGNFSLAVSGASAGVGVDVYQNGVKTTAGGMVARALGAQTAFLSTNIFKPKQGPLSIGFKPQADDHVTVRIFNTAGELVQPVAEMDVKAGIVYAANWDGKNTDGRWVASGIYIVSVHGAHIHTLKKVVCFK